MGPYGDAMQYTLDTLPDEEIEHIFRDKWASSERSNAQLTAICGFSSTGLRNA